MTDADLRACLARLQERIEGVREQQDRIVRAQEAAVLELREWRRDHDASREAMAQRLESGYVTVGNCLLIRQDYVSRGQLAKLGAWLLGLAVTLSMAATGIAGVLLAWLRGP